MRVVIVVSTLALEDGKPAVFREQIGSWVCPGSPRRRGFRSLEIASKSSPIPSTFRGTRLSERSRGGTATGRSRIFTVSQLTARRITPCCFGRARQVREVIEASSGHHRWGFEQELRNLAETLEVVEDRLS
jgi:hypothetical protein